MTHGAGLPLVEGMLPRIKNAERDHHLSQRVVDGAKEAAERARRLEEEYKVTETLRDSAWNAFQRAKELEQQHQIQHRVAEAFQEGWEASSHSPRSLQRERVCVCPLG